MPSDKGLSKDETLAGLLKRGPWQTMDGTVSREMVSAAYRAIVNNEDLAHEIETARGLWLSSATSRPLRGMSDDRASRCTRLLKKAGLVRFDRGSRRWVTT